jgi:hypothetical protein
MGCKTGHSVRDVLGSDAEPPSSPERLGHYRMELQADNAQEHSKCRSSGCEERDGLGRRGNRARDALKI